MNYEYENEISLYDILDVLKKHLKKSIFIGVIGISLSLGFALVARVYRKTEYKQQYRINYAMIDNNIDYQKLELNYIKFDPREIFQSEDYLNLFWGIEGFEVFAQKYNITYDTELEKKIKFFSKFINVKWNNDTESNDLIVSLGSNQELGKKIIQKYFDILDTRIKNRIIYLMEKERPRIENLNRESSAKLEDLEKKVYEALVSLGKDHSPAQEMNIALHSRYPRLMVEKDLYQSVYAKTSSQLIAINQLYSSNVLEKIVQIKSSLMEFPDRKIVKMILMIGLILTFLVVFLRIFLIEFILGYQEHRKKKQNTLIQK